MTAANYTKYGDLRYTKPESYSINGGKFGEGGNWQDLFLELMERYSKTHVVTEGNLSFIDTGARKLLVKNLDASPDDAKLRKQAIGGLWLLTNFDSRRLCQFCFALASEMNIDLVIKIRPTKWRAENRLKS